MGQRYAAKTTVSSDKSRSEIESTLRRYGADQFLYGWEDGNAVVAFRVRGLHIRMNLPLPRMDEFRFTETGRERTRDSQLKACEQAERQAWRAFLLVIKAKLEAVEAGITTLEEEFLANMVLPDNSTIAEVLIPRLQEAVTTGKLPPMLPTGRG